MNAQLEVEQNTGLLMFLLLSHFTLKKKHWLNAKCVANTNLVLLYNIHE